MHGCPTRGGERGIRTLEGLLTLTPLAGERFRPLSHLSVSSCFFYYGIHVCRAGAPSALTRIAPKRFEGLRQPAASKTLCVLSTIRLPNRLIAML